MNLSGGLIYIGMLSFILESKPYSETSLTGISSNISCSLILKIEKGEGQESEESRIIYTLAPLDKKLITSDKKKIQPGI